MVSAAFLMMVAFLVVPAIVSAQAPDTGDETRRVVILNSTDPYLPAFQALDSAMREAIDAESAIPVEFYSEALDMHRFPKTLLEQDEVALLKKKYRDLKVDVVVALGSVALDFANRHLEEIWPGTAIVFNSVPGAVLRTHDLAPRTIGVPVELEFGRTIDLALKLRPQTRRIVVVAGTAEPDRRHLAFARTALERYAGRIDIQYLAGLTLADTVAAVEDLPPDAVVLYLTVFRDGSGGPHVPRDVLERIAEVSPVPVFGVFETYVGYGIAAGSIVSYEVQGRKTGELVVRVLNGDDPSEIGVPAPAEPACMADWKQLDRWALDPDQLPPDCAVRFAETTTWDRYRWQILAVLAVVLAQTGLIVALMLGRRRLRYAQALASNENERRSRAEAIAARLRGKLARFSKQRTLGSMATSISHEINQPLIAIQNYAQAARRRLGSNDYEMPKIIELFEKIEQQAARAGAITRRVRSLVNSTEPVLSPTPLCPLFEAVVRMMASESEARGCRIECEPASELPDVLADPLQIQLVLVNLLQNAMQSVCSGEQYDRRVTVDVRPIDHRQVQVSVADRGPGVPQQRLEEIFESLESGTSSGMGMGLSICRDIVDAHGGRIWCEPNPGGGAVFRFTLQTAGS